MDDRDLTDINTHIGANFVCEVARNDITLDAWSWGEKERAVTL